MLSKIIGVHLSFITKIPGDTLLTKMPAELPSAEQIFTETSHLVPLIPYPLNISRATARNSLRVQKFQYSFKIRPFMISNCVVNSTFKRYSIKYPFFSNNISQFFSDVTRYCQIKDSRCFVSLLYLLQACYIITAISKISFHF